MGHDLGHTPFGHAGERALAEHLPFEHNLQSLRIVEKLENGRGLNLTFEVRDGIKNHKKRTTPATLEGMAVNYADRIAYLNHDIDDALRAGVLVSSDLPVDCLEVLGESHSSRINTMITDIVLNSQGKPKLCMTQSVQQATEKLRNFMFETVYVDSPAKVEEKKVKNIIDLLFHHCMKHPEILPDHNRARISEDGLEVCVADYIAGMTDRYAVTLVQDLFVPHSWTML